MSKILIGIGILLIVVGVIIWGLGKAGIPMGSLPGDINYSNNNFNFSFPIVTSIIVSIVLTIVINLALMIFRK